MPSFMSVPTVAGQYTMSQASFTNACLSNASMRCHGPHKPIGIYMGGLILGDILYSGFLLLVCSYGWLVLYTL